MTHPTVAHNRAHREDLIWAKAGRSEYLRSDGVVIRKHPRISAWWEIFLPSGERPQLPSPLGNGEHYSALPASAQTLHHAKEIAEHVTVDSPVYKPRGRA